MKYRIEHLTQYDYSQEVSASHHLARLKPMTGEGQDVLEFEMEVEPEPADVRISRDYFGNEVQRFALQELHTSLKVKTTSLVTVSGEDVGLVSLPWTAVRDEVRVQGSRDYPDACEYVFASGVVPVGREFANYASRFFKDGTPVLEGARELTRAIYEEFSFDPTATTVSTPVATVLRKKKGVCQDFAHFQIACLRSIGLPARYVSGYVRTEPPPGQPRMQGADATHAWVSVYCPGLGWTEFDPTNDLVPTDTHVRLAYGRDFSDISPLRGTVVGGGGQQLTIGVTMTPMEE
ncbi:transglutaminase [Haloferula helveola]|uniref:Transglutaminase n=1 Tax=Haloferula helveola TaxID=490095 RepID=A0ABN6H1S1_9BACT|nr:transglutaminase [Haloferula helveola]